jgi:hypothetical protein
MKRIMNRRDLVEVAEQLGVCPDWHEPGEQDVDVRIEGENFDNCGAWPEESLKGGFTRDWKGEFCIVLTKDGEDVAVVNLASLFAMAANHPNSPLR